MEELNQSEVSEFIILGLCDSWELQAFFLVIFSSLYLITILGNIFIVVIITTDIHLHSPMYFLLSNLLFFDFCLSSITTYKIITDFLKEKVRFSLDTSLEGVHVRLSLDTSLEGVRCYYCVNDL